MFSFKLDLFFVLLAFVTRAYGANILACVISASRSHHIAAAIILEELAARGHNVTVLSTLPVSQKELPKTYKHVHVAVEYPGEWSTLRTELLNYEAKKDESLLYKLQKMMNMMSQRTSAVLKHSVVQDLLKSDQKFDLFLFDYIINDSMLGLAGHFRVPSVIFSLIPAMKTLRDIVGNPAAVASASLYRETIPSLEISFRQRFGQFMGYVMEFLITTIVEFLVQRKLYEEHFPASDNYPTLDEVRKNVSLILVNSHFSGETIRPHLPNLVEVGGIHIKPKPDPLPKNIQDIVDASGENGVIVFTFGGNIKSSDMTAEKLQTFFNVFSKLKQKIIWKWESDVIPVEKPDNVHMLKWVPQVDILAQPQVRFFISHCGIGGVHEAKYHGVPILAFPIYLDQPANAKLITNQGWAITLDLRDINETILSESVHELLSNQSYKNAAKRESQLFRDRPMTPLQTAIYWIEYVLRYDGAKHMQSPAAHLNFIQRTSLDVILCLAVIVYVLIRVTVKLIKLIIRYRPLLVILVSIITYYTVLYLRMCSRLSSEHDGDEVIEK